MNTCQFFCDFFENEDIFTPVTPITPMTPSFSPGSTPVTPHDNSCPGSPAMPKTLGGKQPFLSIPITSLEDIDITSESARKKVFSCLIIQDSTELMQKQKSISKRKVKIAPNNQNSSRISSFEDSELQRNQPEQMEMLLNQEIDNFPEKFLIFRVMHLKLGYSEKVPSNFVLIRLTTQNFNFFINFAKNAIDEQILLRNIIEMPLIFKNLELFAKENKNSVNLRQIYEHITKKIENSEQSKIKKLDLICSDSQIDEILFKNLILAINQNKSIKIFKYRCENPKDSTLHFEVLSKTLNNAHNLKKLDFSSCPMLSESAFQSLSQFLENPNCESIETLTFQHGTVDNHVKLQNLRKGIENNKWNLKKLDFSHSNFPISPENLQFWEELKKILDSSKNKLQKISFFECSGIDSKIEEFFGVLSQKASNFSTLDLQIKLRESSGNNAKKTTKYAQDFVDFFEMNESVSKLAIGIEKRVLPILQDPKYVNLQVLKIYLAVQSNSFEKIEEFLQNSENSLTKLSIVCKNNAENLFLKGSFLTFIPKWLQILKIDGMKINYDKFYECFAVNSLKELVISNFNDPNLLEDVLLRLFKTGRLSNLEKLTLKCPNDVLSDYFMEELGKLLSPFHSKDRELDNDEEKGWGDEVEEEENEGFQESRLEELNLIDCGIEDNGFISFSENFLQETENEEKFESIQQTGVSNLKILNLKENSGISSEGIEDFISRLEKINKKIYNLKKVKFTFDLETPIQMKNAMEKCFER